MTMGQVGTGDSPYRASSCGSLMQGAFTSQFHERYILASSWWKQMLDRRNIHSSVARLSQLRGLGGESGARVPHFAPLNAVGPRYGGKGSAQRSRSHALIRGSKKSYPAE